MIEIVDGQLRFADAPADHRLVISHWRDEAWQPIALRADGHAYTSRGGAVTVKISFTPRQGAIDYRVSFASPQPTRLAIAIELPGAADPFHVIPACIAGDNNLGPSGPDEFPHLSTQHAGSRGCSPYWECRADRASHPLSGVVFAGGLAAVSVQPYSDAGAGFVRNGVFAQLRPTRCGVTIGYANWPSTFIARRTFGPATQHTASAASASGSIYLRPASDRRAIHDVIRDQYRLLRDKPAPSISRETAARELLTAFVEINWHDAEGKNAAGRFGGVATPWFGGKPFINDFTNQRCADPEKRDLRPWRTLAEIGWSGGAATAYPIYRAGNHFDDMRAARCAVMKLDRIAHAINPATGLFFDVAGSPEAEGNRLRWWWSDEHAVDCHHAYLQASACTYLLEAARLIPGSGYLWRYKAQLVLDRVLELQQPSGSFGFTYRADRLEMLDADGFGGAWFLPALAMAFQNTRYSRYLDAARRAVAYYHPIIRNLATYRGVLDMGNAIDHDGALGFVRGCAMWHELGFEEFLQPAVDGADYDCLWRYAYRTRPEFAPLKDSRFNSCGGSVVCNYLGMTDPMGLPLAPWLQYLSGATGDRYFADRADDSLDWVTNNISMYGSEITYAPRGVLTERWCPTDGLTVETWPDGSPASIWFSYNGWAAAAALEGLIESTAG